MGFVRPIVFGNWKMNGLRADGLNRARAIAEGAAGLGGTVGIFPPATVLAEVAAEVSGSAIIVGAQDCHEQPHGAFTGSIAAPMIVDAGATAVILGHSERRHGLGESDDLVARKVQAALDAGLASVVVCIGETESERAGGARDEILARQIAASLPAGSDIARLIVAYEPVWAIGTGRTPSLSDIESAHGFVRARLAERFKGGATIPILYGGSVKPDNARPILGLPGVDGALVGGASLETATFLAIVRAGGGG